MSHDVYQTVLRLVADQANRAPGDLTLDTTLDDDLMFDSLDTVELQMSVEDKFGIETADQAWANARTIRSVIDLVEEARVND